MASPILEPIHNSGKAEESAEAEQRTDTPVELEALQGVADTKYHDQEIERMGVCPASKKDL